MQEFPDRIIAKAVHKPKAIDAPLKISEIRKYCEEISTRCEGVHFVNAGTIRFSSTEFGIYLEFSCFGDWSPEVYEQTLGGLVMLIDAAHPALDVESVFAANEIPRSKLGLSLSIKFL
ncbi:MAG: hypothetical protein OD815_001840 [Candidatus Alkanophagales archaeon MCA70_species_2]|nr:hypothetical protein [Candidatus Alkanophaga liquidiphilum]